MDASCRRLQRASTDGEIVVKQSSTVQIDSIVLQLKGVTAGSATTVWNAGFQMNWMENRQMQAKERPQPSATLNASSRINAVEFPPYYQVDGKVPVEAFPAQLCLGRRAWRSESNTQKKKKKKKNNNK